MVEIPQRKCKHFQMPPSHCQPRHPCNSAWHTLWIHHFKARFQRHGRHALGIMTEISVQLRYSHLSWKQKTGCWLLSHLITYCLNNFLTLHFQNSLEVCAVSGCRWEGWASRRFGLGAGPFGGEDPRDFPCTDFWSSSPLLPRTRFNTCGVFVPGQFSLGASSFPWHPSPASPLQTLHEAKSWHRWAK